MSPDGKSDAIRTGATDSLTFRRGTGAPAPSVWAEMHTVPICHLGTDEAVLGCLLEQGTR